ncbi:hypothetical protein PG988_007708 [Apiospora saccharicola]
MPTTAWRASASCSAEPDCRRRPRVLGPSNRARNALKMATRLKGELDEVFRSRKGGRGLQPPAGRGPGRVLAGLVDGSEAGLHERREAS